MPSHKKLVQPKIYISGCITGAGDIATNLEKFHEAERDLVKLGWEVFNPARIPPPPFNGEGMSKEEVWQWYMRRCIAALPTCNYIYMLRNWEQSTGATEELRIAKLLGLNVVSA
jgi:hypothetical protein